MTAPPTSQTNPLDPVFSGVPVVIPQSGTVNPTWNKWFVDLREKVNVINQTLATLSGGSIDPSTGGLAISSGGTGATTVAGAQANLGILANPMTAAGDIIIGGTGGTPTRLAKGTNGYRLTLVSGVPAWAADGGGGGSSAIDVFNFPMTGTNNGWSGYTIRLAIPGCYLPTGSKISIQFITNPGTSTTFAITGCWVGNSSVSGQGYPINFSGTPTQVTFGGSNTISVTGGKGIFSDTITFSTVVNTPIVISFQVTSGDAATPSSTSTDAGIQGYNIANATDGSNPTTSGYTKQTGAVSYFIKRVLVFT